MEDMSDLKSAANDAASDAAAMVIINNDDILDFSTNPIVQKLDALAIQHVTYPHTLSMTADELVANVPLPSDNTESHTKNLFFKDKKHGLFLITTCTDAELDTKELGKLLKLDGKVNLRLADEELLLEKLACKKGCVGPLSLMNNADKDVTLVLDEKLMSMNKIHSHPMRNDASTALAPVDLLNFLKEVGVSSPTMLSFPKKSTDQLLPGKVPSSRPTGDKSSTKPTLPPKDKNAPKSANVNKKQTKKGETQLALKWKKSENFAMWYTDVIVLSEMISYYDISGCYILRPWSYKIWELIQDWFNIQIRKLGVENSYFPMFVSKDRLEKEKDHVEGFAPEVAWVTKSGDGDLAAPIAVRPTSETIMYPAFADWIRSHRDLPLKLNQWSNVVRWEFKDPTPFLRTREFLWQEGHTAHTSFEDANVMVRQALDLYRRVYEELLAIPVIPGYKTEKEKFAGGHTTTTVEAYIPISGRAIQGATSHHLGQNFGKMFDINYQDEKGETQVVWQTSWGLTTRTIGVMVMVHGDDTGLVLPPRVAPLQAVIVPIVSKSCPLENLAGYCEEILKKLDEKDIRCKLDDRSIYNPGWKYAHWEQKGVPIRIEVGPRDLETKSARMVVRFGGEKIDVSVEDLAEAVAKKLEEVQSNMFTKAKEFRDDHLVKVTEWKDFVPNLELHNLVLTPWCGGEHDTWEEWVKEKSREESLQSRGEDGEDARAATSVAAKTLCIPFSQPELADDMKCIASGLPATCWVLWGRSY
jgi:prolyl-tRNA synthetase